MMNTYRSSVAAKIGLLLHQIIFNSCHQQTIRLLLLLLQSGEITKEKARALLAAAEEEYVVF
jgi:hypothetical protein